MSLTRIHNGPREVGLEQRCARGCAAHASPRCSECDSTNLVAADDVERRFRVATRPLLPAGGSIKPVLHKDLGRDRRPLPA
jgi:hypothetical protein